MNLFRSKNKTKSVIIRGDIRSWPIKKKNDIEAQFAVVNIHVIWLPPEVVCDIPKLPNGVLS